MSFKWEKIGRIMSIEDFDYDWMNTHTQLPIPMKLESGNIRIFLTPEQMAGQDQLLLTLIVTSSKLLIEMKNLCWILEEEEHLMIRE